ncbi:MAG: 1-acyl-sn-glycerol-3-phosphate acyltransferase [Cyclobacteriaceae bacterium]|nr:1-acyl-sn-glycerol-3-phosphate acyltransferase [Cyclobacteriaceae bacterium HetDA_MAG_MS6]
MRLPIQVISDSTLRKDQPYIICANHFSYLDIATMGMVPVPFKFIGKNAMNRIPLFGYMYRKLHITVNRTSIRSRAESLKQARTAIEDGYSVVFFPEGGMITTNPPMMVPFKEGAFRLSAIMNIPILPVVLPDNYKCMPDDPSLRIFRRPLRIKLLRPVWPSSAEVNEETRRLKQEIFDLLQAELKAEKQE